MARKNVLVEQLAANQSLAANFTSAPTLIKYLDNCAYQINVTTSDSVGSFVVQGSLDFAISEPVNVTTDPGNWSDLTLSGTPAVAAGNDVISIDLHQLPYNAIRLKYTSAVAGTGVCDVYIMAKQVGG